MLSLNTCRAAEEATGLLRWLRPSFQDPARRAAASAGAGSTAVAGQQNPLNLPAADVVATEAEALDVASVPAAKAAPISRLPWPADNKEQFRSVADLLAASHVALTEAQMAERYTGRGPWKKRLSSVLETLEAVARAQRDGDGWRAA